MNKEFKEKDIFRGQTKVKEALEYILEGQSKGYDVKNIYESKVLVEVTLEKLPEYDVEKAFDEIHKEMEEVFAEKETTGFETKNEETFEKPEQTTEQEETTEEVIETETTEDVPTGEGGIQEVVTESVEQSVLPSTIIDGVQVPAPDFTYAETLETSEQLEEYFEQFGFNANPRHKPTTILRKAKEHFRG